MRVLLVEDDERIGGAVCEHVTEAGHVIDWARTLAEANSAIRGTQRPELILLDLSLPDGNGLDFLRRLRAGRRNCGVVVMTAHDRLSDRIKGLDAGADDYLVKPFALDELSARMRAVERRQLALSATHVQIDSLAIDLDARRVEKDGKPVDLTGSEWALLERLARRPGAIVSKSELEGALYDPARDVDPNAIEALVSRLRKKLGKNAVATARGIGYRLNGTE